jgi:Flp pilus assembly protein TadD
MTTLRQTLDEAVQLQESGRADEAAALCQAILAKTPDHADALHLAGVLAYQRGDNDAALAFIDEAIAREPSAANFHNSRGLVHRAQGRLDAAAAAHRRALELAPDFYEAASNLGNALHQQGEIAAAIDCYRRALALAPGHAVLNSNLGTALYDLGDLTGAEDCYRRAIAADPNCADAHFHLGMIRLHRGDYAEGWREYEWRWRAQSFRVARRNFGVPQWRGEDLNGARILLHVEQGFGDALQFVRYAPLVAARGGRVILGAPDPLRRLFAGIPGIERVVGKSGATPDFAWHAPLMSLPLAFGTELASVPAAIPYLGVDAAIAEHWRERIGTGGKSLRVGVVWAGQQSWKSHYVRALPVEALAPLAAVPGVEFFSLQKNAAAPLSWARDLALELGDFADTAGAIGALDLVITVDTAVAHLAGALGKPVWIMLQRVSDWRWLESRDDSPWYPSARLFRQTVAGEWAGPIERVAAALRQLPKAGPGTAGPDNTQNKV